MVKILADNNADIEKTNNNIDETADLCVKYEIVAKKPIAIAAIPRREHVPRRRSARASVRESAGCAGVRRITRYV